MTAPAPTPQAGDSLGNGRYVVTELIGEGAQGQTLQAIDKRDGTLVAIKRFSVRGASSWKDVELAEREARVLAQLDHPGLPRHLDHFEEDGALYLVMTLVEGESLAELRQRGELLDAAEVRSLLGQMAEILDYLGQRAPPVIHRDIKPSNIVRRATGSYALVDFGSVRDHLKRDGSTVVGTFGYMAPEQFQGRALPVSDVYGLGATALTLLTGVAPDQQPHRGLGIDVARALGPGADPELVALLGGMLTPDPDVRTRNLAAALRPQAARRRANYWQRSLEAQPEWSR
ncbi:MAG: serine/threonine-protein kinase [Polyangiaceae bacterium]